MPITWAAALRLYSKDKGHFVVPRKGSEDYEAVKKLQQETADGPEHAVKKRGSKKGKSEEEGAMGGKVVKGVVKGKKAPTPGGAAAEQVTAAGDALLPPRAHTTEIDEQFALKKSKKVVRDTISKPKKEKAIQRDGKTKAADQLQVMAEENTGPSATVSNQLPGQKAMIAAELKEAKKQVKAKVLENPPEPTIDGMKTDDPKAIEAKAPFSILSLRKKLLA